MRKLRVDMGIKEIITKHFETLHNEVNGELVISQGRTTEDILQDICITAIRKFKDQDITEEEGLTYLQKTLFTEMHFSWNRKKGDILVFGDVLPEVLDA
jgi:hypothetical protein